MAGTTLRPRPAQHRSKPFRNRTARQHISYREQTTDSDEPDQFVSENDSDPKSSQPLSRIAPPPVPQTKAKASRKRKSVDPGHRRLLTRKVKTSHTSFNAKHHGDPGIQLTGKKMPWQTLPYHIWLSIFDYASRPLIGETFQPMPSINWLLNVALCCKAFTEPALSTLYYSPPLSPPTRAYSLLERLATQTGTSTFNYKAKIRYLDLEASSILLHKYAGQDPVDLGAFVAFTPQLRGIGIHLISDNPKLRKAVRIPRSTNGKAAYQQSLFAALEEYKVTLQEWTWNFFLAWQTIPLHQLKEIHETAPFQSLRHISFVNYEGGAECKMKHHGELLAEALDILPKLESVSFRTCSIVSDRLLSLIPANLQTLEVVDCALLKSPALNIYLSTKGRNLKRLTLDHNSSLNLSFLASLAKDCPKLEHLRMDLRYFNSFVTVKDSDPRYDVLFAETEKPSWPSSLRSLELYHLRKWSLEMAQIFFSSLTEAAKSLLNLRQLRIKASLEASGWRDRVEFRDKFTGRLRRIYLRKSSPPNSNFRSIQAFKASKRQHNDEWRKGLEKKLSTASRTTTRSSGRHKAREISSHVDNTQNAAEKEDSDSDIPLVTAPKAVLEGSDGDAPIVKVRRSRRVRPQMTDIRMMSENSPGGLKASSRRRRQKGPGDSSSEDSALEEDVVGPISRSHSDDEEDELYIQGLCEVVDVLIDNLRPTEEQLNEDDFLDEEASGDEDWNGDDDMIGDDPYAW
ncbi:hypothetical protein N7G274_005636 [Stereocaulon virgatum]|uniref:F-box domain-containing protein n=1 Tax=Stereocaulon virgatum TaxID=373712 RepID=A0ABR4AAD7_9LECA